jgi:hypothetical protein
MAYKNKAKRMQEALEKERLAAANAASPSDSLGDQGTSPAQPENSGIDGILGQAEGYLGADVPGVPGEPPKKQWKKWNPAAKREMEEVTTMISSLFVLVVAGWRIPPALKPNEDETNAVSGAATRILLRHVDLTGKMTKDAVDVIGIIAVSAAWYTRTAPLWAQYRELQSAQAIPKHDSSGDPIAETDPAAALFLGRRRGGDSSPDPDTKPA